MSAWSTYINAVPASAGNSQEEVVAAERECAQALESVDNRDLIRIAAECARLVLPFGDKRPAQALAVLDRYLSGGASRADVSAARREWMTPFARQYAYDVAGARVAYAVCGALDAVLEADVRACVRDVMRQAPIGSLSILRGY